MDYVEDKIIVNMQAYALSGMWQEIIACVILFLWSCVEMQKEDWRFVLFLWPLLLILLIYIWTSHYTLIFDKEGCTKKFLFYKKRYRWDDLQVKQLYTSYVYSYDVYKEGVVFLTKRETSEKIKYNITNYVLFHPMSCIIVNFEGTFRMDDVKDGQRMRGCEVNKQEFLRKMDEWGITLTHLKTLGRSNKAELLGEQEALLELDQVIVQSDREAKRSAKFSFIAAVSGIVILTGIKQVLEDPSGAIFACLVMVSLGCVIVMVSSFYNLYTVIIDEKGCTKLLGRYRKRYMWDELEIRQICSPMGQYTEGILFATKRKFPNVKNPRWYYRLHPFSSFVVNFKGKRMAMGKNPGTQHIDRCAVNKKLLLARLAEWGIELEDTRFRK